MEKLPILFRRDRTKDFEVTAVFPTIAANNKGDMTCYAHVGQHAACSYGWYQGTRPAVPSEYSDLWAELLRRYSNPNDPDAVELVVVKRITAKHRAALRESLS